MGTVMRFTGELDIISKIISEEGRDRLKQYLAERPDLNELQRRRVNSVFLEKFVLDDTVEIEIDLPGWTDDLVDKMTEVYEADINVIANMPGVNFIAP